jgi:pimeloyl-ACP methyl ester carboxylesterase
MTPASSTQAVDVPERADQGERRARAAAAVVAVGVAAAVGRRVYRTYRADMDEAYAAVDDADNECIETSAGTLEYRVRGSGVPVLVSHGIVGGFDQALQTGEALFDGDVRVIGASRFGYLGSELPTEATPEDQARAYAELLDHLGIDEAVVVGTSAGGAPAIRFVLDYPDRTRALVLIGPTAPSEGELEGPTGPPHAILRDPIFWFLVNHAPWVFLRLFGVDPGEYASASPGERRRVEALLETLVPVEPRKRGIYNDERVTNTAMIENYDEYDLETLDVPTLVVHAEDDPLASFEDARRMVDRIPDAEFLRYETGGHLVFGHGEEIRQSNTEFVEAAGHSVRH